MRDCLDSDFPFRAEAGVEGFSKYIDDPALRRPPDTLRWVLMIPGERERETRREDVANRSTRVEQTALVLLDLTRLSV